MYLNFETEDGKVDIYITESATDGKHRVQVDITKAPVTKSGEISAEQFATLVTGYDQQRNQPAVNMTLLGQIINDETVVIK